MDLPPRVKTQYPNRENIIDDDETPIPIEYAFFLEDGTPDPYVMNRHHFNFPGNWATSNNGETIIGIRNISVVPRRRKVEFDLSVRKYLRKAFEDLKNLKKTVKVDTVNVDTYPNINKSTDELYNMLGETEKGEVSCHIISWLDNTHDLRELFRDIRVQLKKQFDIYNNIIKTKNKLTDEIIQKAYHDIFNLCKSYIKPFGTYRLLNNVRHFVWGVAKTFTNFKNEYNGLYAKYKKNLVPLFHLEDGENAINDIQMDGYYDYQKNQFVETLFSPNNVKVDNYVDSSNKNDSSNKDDSKNDTNETINSNDTNETINTNETNSTGDKNIITTPPTPTPTPAPSPTESPPPQEPYVKETDDQSFGSLYYIDFKIDFNEKVQDDNYTKYDFVDIMNIGTEQYQNNPKQYQGKWLRRLDFYNVWDRKPCKIYSSLAEQSNHGYIGNSDVEYSPIKYYKLNSTDQRFWIDFYSSAYHNMPVKIPKNESFCIEMQFLPFNKKLNL